MVVSELIPMQIGGDEKKSGEEKHTNVRSPDTMPFFTNKNGRKKDYAIYIRRADEHCRHRRRNGPGKQLFRASGKKVEDAKSEQDNYPKKRRNELGECINAISTVIGSHWPKNGVLVQQ
jgi:hypothetical protein